MRTRQASAIPVEADLIDPRLAVDREPRSERAERPPTAETDLEGAHDAALVRGFDAPGGDRVEDAEAVVEGGDLGISFELGPQLRPTAGEIEPVGDRPQVETGAADEQWPVAAPVDLVPSLVVGGDAVGHGEHLARVDEVDAVVADLRALGLGRLGGADVEAPIDLHGVDRDQLDVLAGECGGVGERGLAGRGGTDDGDGTPWSGPARRVHDRATTGMRVTWLAGATTSTRVPRRWCGAAPVISTVTYVPGRTGEGAVKWTSLFWRVRPLVTLGVALARTLDEELLDPSDPGFVLGQGAALDDDPQPLEALAGDDGIDEPIGHLGRFGARVGARRGTCRRSRTRPPPRPRACARSRRRSRRGSRR